MVARRRIRRITLRVVQSVAVGIVLALAASGALNTAFLVQHAGAVDLPAVSPRRPVATLRALLGSRTWLVGLALGCVGWALHVGALARAPLSLVQAFISGGLAVTLPVAAVALGHRLRARELHAIALTALALVLLSLGLHGGRHATAAPGALAAATAGLAAVALALALGVRDERRPVALGLAGGLLYGTADMAIKALTGVASGSGAAEVLSSRWLVVAIVATAAAFFAFQRALQSHRPVVVIALMTAATNVSAIVGGLVVFGDPLGATPVLVAAHLAAFALVAGAAWRLAPAQAGLVVEPQPHRRRIRAPTGSAPGRQAS
jgi:drug/metabolite transporter (DMT)-like permease